MNDEVKSEFSDSTEITNRLRPNTSEEQLLRTQLQQQQQKQQEDETKNEDVQSTISKVSNPQSTQTTKSQHDPEEMATVAVDYATMPARFAYHFVLKCINLSLWPAKQVIRAIMPTDITANIAKTRQDIRTTTHQTLEPVIGSIKINVIRLIIATIVVCFSISFATGLYAAIYWYFIPKHFQETQLFFQHSLNRVVNQDQLVPGEKVGSHLVATVNIDSALTDFVATDKNDDATLINSDVNNIRMDDESYAIEVVMEVAETHYNFQAGNIYLQAKFNAFNPLKQPLHLQRMGTLEYKGSIFHYIRELLQMVPFSHYFVDTRNSQIVSIQLTDAFDNSQFGVSQLELAVNNHQLMFKNAHLRVRTALFGVRYYMRQWFFTVALAVISTITASICITMTVLYLLVKIYYLPWL